MWSYILQRFDYGSQARISFYLSYYLPDPGLSQSENFSLVLMFFIFIIKKLF